ncbi:MAG: ribonuclease P protein component [Methylophilus sp.]|nr:ribonuclease P protein component [Methylophilus sp.]
MQKLIMLKKTDEFSSVFSFKKRFSSSFFVVHYKPNQAQHVQVGFVVAKKVAKLAVDRNYMRRVLREFCRHELSATLCVDVIIQVQKKFENKDYSLVNQELVTIFNKIQNKLFASSGQ